MPSFPDIAGRTAVPAKEPAMTSPATLAAGLRTHAQGRCCLTAAAELLIAQSWLHRADFAGRFITVHPGTGGRQPVGRHRLARRDHRPGHQPSLLRRRAADAEDHGKPGRRHPR